MNIYAISGDKVKFNHPTAGHEEDQKICQRYLKEDEIYTVSHTEVGGWSTQVYLKEVPNVAFNSVMFDDVSNKVLEGINKILNKYDNCSLDGAAEEILEFINGVNFHYRGV